MSIRRIFLTYSNRLESAHKKLYNLLDKQPRWLRPRASNDMQRRMSTITELSSTSGYVSISNFDRTITDFYGGELNQPSLVASTSRPFQCHVPGCYRPTGFISQNDLDRHLRSVHRDRTVPGQWLVCPHGQCANKDPQKLWSRADNFRSHLQRVHSIELGADADLQRYIFKDAYKYVASPHDEPCLILFTIWY